jgi:hypothetical protein
MSTRSTSRKTPTKGRGRSRSRSRTGITPPTSPSRRTATSTERAIRKSLDYNITTASRGVDSFYDNYISPLYTTITRVFRRQAPRSAQHAARKVERITGSGVDRISTAVYWWFIISTIVVLWDSAYVLLRPDSMLGGKYSQYFIPYAFYITIGM